MCFLAYRHHFDALDAIRKAVNSQAALQIVQLLLCSGDFAITLYGWPSLLSLPLVSQKWSGTIGVTTLIFFGFTVICTIMALFVIFSIHRK